MPISCLSTRDHPMDTMQLQQRDHGTGNSTKGNSIIVGPNSETTASGTNSDCNMQGHHARSCQSRTAPSGVLVDPLLDELG